MLMSAVGANSAPFDVAVKFDRVNIEFPIYSAHGRSVKRSILQLTTGGRIGLDRRDRAVITALNNISFGRSTVSALASLVTMAPASRRCYGQSLASTNRRAGNFRLR